jgi:hypothetical protein
MAAQDNLFGVGDKVVNLGIGFGGYGTWGYHASIPPVSASFEVGVKDGILDVGSIGIGGFLAYASYKPSGFTTDYWSFNRLVVGARGTFHYPLVDKLDTYGGLMVGYNGNSWKWHGTGAQTVDLGGSGLGYSFFVGGRYYFNEKFAAMAELGYGITTLNLGVAIKL